MAVLNDYLTTYLQIPRYSLVALKRSIDSHISDPRKLEVLREDFDRFWDEVMKADAEGGISRSSTTANKP